MELMSILVRNVPEISLVLGKDLVLWSAGGAEM